MFNVMDRYIDVRLYSAGVLWAVETWPVGRSEVRAPMHRLVACLFALAATAPATAQTAVASEPEVCRIVVLNLLSKNLRDADKGVPGLLTDTLAQQVTIDSGCQVMTQTDVAEMLDFEAAKAACGDGDSCLSEIGSALGAERVIGGSLGRLGNDFIINARLMNVKTGVVEARAEEVVPGAPERLRLAAHNVSRALFGKPLDTDPAAVAVAAPVVSQPGLSPLVYVGAAVGVVGVGGLVVGSVVASGAERQLSDPQQVNKDDTTRTGQLGLGVAGAGVVLAVVGIVAVVVPLVME